MVRLARSKVRPESVRLDVIDQGPGFPPEHIEKLFSPFFTLRPGGTGLGLTIAKKIVEDAGGTILLSNNAERGARVTVFLPVSDTLPPESRSSASECERGCE